MKLLHPVALIGLLGSLGCCFGALADVEAFVVSPVGASITITATLSITTALGTSTDSDTKVVLTSGNAFARCAPDAPVFTNLSVTSLTIDPANVTFHFDLYCFPFIGCQPLDVAVTEFSMVQIGSCASPIVNSVANCPSMQMALVGNYSTTGVATASGVLDGTVASSVATRVQALPKSKLKLDQLTLSPMTIVPDPALLPAGVTALTITIAPAPGAFSMSGTYAVVNLSDLNRDSVVDAVDLAVLLSQWGGAGSADLDGNGDVGAGDLAILLNAWS